MHAFRTTALAALLALVATAPVIAAEQAVTQPKPVVLDTPPPPQKATQSGMENYGMSGMSSDQKAKLTRSVKRNNRQLGHGMGGLGEAKPAAKAPAKLKKASGKKAKKDPEKEEAQPPLNLVDQSSGPPMQQPFAGFPQALRGALQEKQEQLAAQ
jgi:hypothetical protein